MLIHPSRSLKKWVELTTTKLDLTPYHQYVVKMDDVSIKINNLADPFLLQQIIGMLCQTQRQRISPGTTQSTL